MEDQLQRGVGISPERIREAVQDAGLPQVDLARRLGVTPVALSQWMRGEKSPNPRNLHLLAIMTRQPVSFFFYGQDELFDQLREDAALGRRLREMVLKGEGDLMGAAVAA